MSNRWFKLLGLSITVSAGVMSSASAGQKVFFKKGTFDPSQLSEVEEILPQGLDSIRPTDYFVVQFEQKISPADLDSLAADGVDVLRYVPDDALLVEGDVHELSDWVSANPNARTFLPYVADFKVSPNFEPVSIFNGEKLAVITVQGFASKGDLKAAIGQLAGLKVLSSGNNQFVVEGPLSKLPKLAQIEGVEWIEPYLEPELMHIPFDDSEEAVVENRGYEDATGYETGTKIMGFDDAWGRGLHGEDQIVTMADTGLDTGDLGTLHLDFRGDILDGQVFGMFASSWNDPMGHGTHVAGSVKGNGKASKGVFKGGAYKSKMIAQGMWSKMLGNLTVPPELNKLFEGATSKKSYVHTNSWGRNSAGEYDNFASQVDTFTWENPEFLTIFAAGNSGVDANKDGRIDGKSVGSPGTAKNTLTVGASENYLLKGGIQRQLGELKGGDPWGVEPLKSDRLSDNSNGIAAFSSRGPTTDGRLKPDLVAPGTNIVSACSSVEGASKLWGEYNKEFCYSGGTSMSTPLVAGAAAVVRQYLAKERSVSSPSAALVKNILMHSADDLYPGQYGEVGKSAGQELLSKGPNNHQGFGRVNVERATRANAYFKLLADEKTGVKQGEKKAYNLAGARKMTLVYTDAPSSPSVSKHLVNDLDLVVTLSDGRVLKSEGRIDNSEQVSLVDEAAGVTAVKVEVLGHKVPKGRNGAQPYALVVSAD